MKTNKEIKNKLEIINTLFSKKADENNTIDLHAYESGLRDMYEYISKQNQSTEVFEQLENKEILLWLDDVRNPFIATRLLEHAPEYDEKKESVVWVKSYNEFVDYIENNPMPYKIMFDHDLGQGKSGYDAAKWLVDYCLDNNIKLPKFDSQSANPVGAENIKSLLNNFKKTQNL